MGEELYRIIGTLYVEVDANQRAIANFEKVLKQKDDEITLLKQRVAQFKESLKEKETDGQRISDK